MADSTLQRFQDVAATWRPSPTESHDVVRAEVAHGFAALLDVEPPDTDPGAPLPPLWHWFLFPQVIPHSRLGEDGHPRDGAHMPPVSDRRRMFGGGRLWTHEPLRFADTVTQSTSVTSVRAREGRSGPLLLVTLRRALSVRGVERVIEEQEIVYRPPAPPRGAHGHNDPVGPETVTSRPGREPEPRQDLWQLSVHADPLLLFRFSALTSNAHRIHYDAPYARQIEGHPGLVVHGPLLALLLLELPRRHAPTCAVREFSWRARSPMYAGQTVGVHGRVDKDRAVLAAGTGDDPECVTGTAALGGRP